MLQENIKKIEEIELYFRDTIYSPLVENLLDGYFEGNSKKVSDLIEQFPTKKQLMETLCEKLKGKAVHHTLKEISKKGDTNDVLTAKALSTLVTHVLIECEQGNKEYKFILVDLCKNLFERIEKILYTKQEKS